jgi:hypothetical protein
MGQSTFPGRAKRESRELGSNNGINGNKWIPCNPSLALGGVSGTAHPTNHAAFYLSGISSSWIYSWPLLYITTVPFLHRLAAAASEPCSADDLVGGSALHSGKASWMTDDRRG